ncbi:hypothetical protein RvY_18337 [Ramazzottius varieornatus]|uniref:Uncharacterized protein n=1 Tax=Ramazzottius varieornatus TaxID=947166 RepID=A0A1D1W8Q4_RAMVA|nr:hypothetical protein RvY_18337 [Ramazzottius varieornatus]
MEESGRLRDRKLTAMDKDTLDPSVQHPRKIQKSGDRPDAGRSALADPLQTAGEWKLVLCHVRGRMKFRDIVKFFKDIELKGVVQEVVYGRRKAIEVLFRCKVDMKMALGEYHLPKLHGHQFFLKLPKDALDELDKTEYFWNVLPLHVKDQVFSNLTPFSAGRTLTRVCHEWKGSLHRAKGRYPGLYVEEDISTEKKCLSSALFNPDQLEGPQPPERSYPAGVMFSVCHHT